MELDLYGKRLEHKMVALWSAYIRATEFGYSDTAMFMYPYTPNT